MLKAAEKAFSLQFEREFYREASYAENPGNGA
jgi:hypothetical protein